MGTIEQNLEIIKQKISKAAGKSGRLDSEVQLLAVSKTHPADKILLLQKLGVHTFGESKVQEALLKIREIKDSSLDFHFIGNLQTNKVKDVVGNFKLIQSIDRYKLLEEVNKAAGKKGIIQDILIQVNPAKESQKGGIYKEDLEELVMSCSENGNIKLRGFMVIPPYRENPEDNREIFKEMYNLFVYYKDINHGIDILSMGMSDDFETAVEEGSTLVRVGTALFGNR